MRQLLIRTQLPPWKSYALATALGLAAVALTWYTWPFVSAAPFVFAFGAVAFSAHFGSAGAGFLATAISAVGLALLFPHSLPYSWSSPSPLIYASIGVTGSYLIAGRNRAVAALRASEAELRRTLTQMRESEERLRRAQKMEAVGQLAAGVAHNFNNLLQVTLACTDVLLDTPRDAEFDRATIAEIRKATERGAALTRQLMAFGRRHEPRPARLPVDAAIGALREMLTRVIREDIELAMTFDTHGAAVLIDPVDLEQAIFNLVLNARDALPSGGTIALDASRVTVDGTEPQRDETVASGDYIRLRVTDNGVGMTPDVQAHLFEPFFTTKEVGEGTGLGLAFVHGVARTSGGFVSVESAPGKGTALSLFLPIAPAPAAPPQPVAAVEEEPAPRASQPARILLVEDEEGVRETTARILTRAGYRVTSASSPTEAWNRFEFDPAAVDLLLTDVVMPDMHGPELAARVAAVRPDLPVVFISGYSDAMPALTVVASRARFVPKPFSASSLLAAVETVLAPLT